MVFPNYEYYYIGDNIKKDFIAPNKLNWNTIGIKDTNSENIHSQLINVKKEFLPNIWISCFDELISFLL